MVTFSEQRVERNDNPTRDAVAQRKAMFAEQAKAAPQQSTRDDSFVSSINMQVSFLLHETFSVLQ